jgi:hypothetical protein
MIEVGHTVDDRERITEALPMKKQSSVATYRSAYRPLVGRYNPPSQSNPMGTETSVVAIQIKRQASIGFRICTTDLERNMLIAVAMNAATIITSRNE